MIKGFSISEITELSPLQFLKALMAMDFTELGIVTNGSLLHPSKAEPPMDCKPLLNVNVVR